jgi:predicted ArsR family transcriptional regulator
MAKTTGDAEGPAQFDGEGKGERAPRGRRLEVLRALKAATTSLSLAEVAADLDMHTNTARFHLDALVRSGRAERVRAEHRQPGRPALRYRAVSGMDPTGPRQYRVLAEILTSSLAAGPATKTRAIAAGRAWGQAIAATDLPAETPAGSGVGQLIGLLGSLGFAPERREAESGIGLRHCPFLELAETQADVVCPIHLGLMQGALEAWRAETTVDRLEPFVEPDLCMAHLVANGGES